MNNILILGGTGFVGRHVCERLQRRGWSITVPTRRAVHASAVQHLPRLTVREADVHDPAQLARLLPGHSAVLNLVAILHGNAAAFEAAHVTLPTRLAEACTQAGVRRVIHVSALGADPDGPSLYQRSKAAGEAVWQRSGLDATLLRPSVVFGRGDRFLNLFARLQAALPVVPLASAHTRFQPVWVEDLAQAVVNCLHDRHLPMATRGQTFECTGPEVFELIELVRLAGRLGSTQRPVLPLPMALARLQARFMEWAPGEPLMSRDNLASMAVDNVASSRFPGLDALGISPSALSSVAPTYLGHTGGRSTLLKLRRGAGRP